MLRKRRIGLAAAAAAAIIIVVIAYMVAAKSALSCGYTAGWKAMREADVELLDDNGKAVAVHVRVADDAGTRATGFQHICPSAIDANQILFVFPQARMVRFHMHNVHAALDIAFFHSNGAVISVTRMEPYGPEAEGPRPLYGPAVPVRYALEAAPGFFAARNISARGGRLQIDSLNTL